MLDVNMRLEGIEELITKYHVRATTIVKALDFTTKKNAEEIRVIAKDRAPVLTGILRGSIDKEQKEMMVWGIGSYNPNCPYARIRNYINNLHPMTVGYLTKTHFEHRDKYKKDLQETIRELKKL